MSAIENDDLDDHQQRGIDRQTRSQPTIRRARLPLPVRYEAAGFLDPNLTAEAERVATGLARLGSVDDVDTLLRALSHFRIPRARAASNGD